VQPISRRRLVVALILAVAATAVASALARRSQDPTWRPRIWLGGGRVHRTPPKWAMRETD